MGPSELLEHVVSVFERLGIPYLVTGSVAAMAYGEPRLTNDIDIVAGITERHIPGLLAAFPAEDYYLYDEAVRDAIRRPGQFNIIHPASGLKIDVIIRRNTPFDRSRFGRIRRIHPAENFEADFAAPEDVIIKKMEYYREGGSDKHLRDITGILLTTGDDVDRPYIEQWAQQLGLSEIWEAIEKRLRPAVAHDLEILSMDAAPAPLRPSRRVSGARPSRGAESSRAAREKAELALTPAERLTLALELSDLCAELAVAGRRALKERP